MKLLGLMPVVVTSIGSAAEIPKAPVPPSPYLPIIYKFADAMLEQETNRVAAKESGPAEVTPEQKENWLRVLYTLTELSTKAKYRGAADAELRRFLENAEPKSRPFIRPWVLWDRCFELAPEASKRAALALREHQSGTNSVRESGFLLRALAVAYAHTTNDLFLNTINAVVA